MTQIERTIQMFSTVEKNTVLAKEDYLRIQHKIFKESGNTTRERIMARTDICSWDTVIANPERFNVARIEIYTKTPTSKIKAIDVLEMIKEGKTVEEIEPMLYTQVKSVQIKVL